MNENESERKMEVRCEQNDNEKRISSDRHSKTMCNQNNFIAILFLSILFCLFTVR